MFGVSFINVIFQWLCFPDPLRTGGPPCTDNILDTIPDWGIGGTAINPNWGRQPSGPYGSVALPWSGPVRSMPAYMCRSPENTCSAARSVHTYLLQDNSTVCIQSIFNSHSILCNRLVNRQDCNWDDLWDDLWDDPVDQ